MPLAGGGGTSWAAGDVVLKPAGHPDETHWIAGFVERLDLGGDLRVARHVATATGAYVCRGWTATERVAGRHRSDRWDETLAVARSFHEAAGALSPDWPAFMRDRDDRWSAGTRVAWGEDALPALPPAAARLVDDLGEAAAATSTPPHVQVIHSDLAGNVLFADDPGVPPAVIDVSPQLRPAPYAEAILVADAVAWHGAGLGFAERFLTGSGTRADLARAIGFRVAAAALGPSVPADRVDGEARAYRPLVPLLLG